MATSYTDKIKMRMPAAGDTGWDDEINDNTKVLEVMLAAILNNNYVISGLAPSDGGGLDVDYAVGVVLCNGTKYAVAGGSKTCAASDLNYLYVDNTGTMQIAQAVPTGDYVPIAIIDTGAAAIDRIGDLRWIFGDPEVSSIKIQDNTTAAYNLIIDSWYSFSSYALWELCICG